MAAAKMQFDPIGKAYLSIAIIWTIGLIATMAFLWRHRQLPHLQMRRLPLAFTAMVLLHLYGVAVLIGYIILPVFPCAAEYWLMSILVPFGVALFQVANTQFLYIASQQKRFTSVRSLEELVRGRNVSALDNQPRSLWQRTIRRLKNIDRITRMVIFVGAAMALQVRGIISLRRLY